jgi:hypothetical protein
MALGCTDFPLFPRNTGLNPIEGIVAPEAHVATDRMKLRQITLKNYAK